jgi:transaldolase/glucose-6-phosphate isomerase
MQDEGAVRPGVLRAGVLRAAVDAHEQRARDDHARLMAHDTALWPPDAHLTAPWLGWLDSLARAPGHLERIAPVVEAILAEGVDDVVLVGMGGSSLFPLVLAGACDPAAGRPRLHVLDSTDPAAVARVEAQVDWRRCALVAASKSGTTVETRAHLDRLLERLSAAVGPSAPRRVAVITDPGSPLERVAAAEGIAGIVSGDADVGGRYSALSPFGLVPALLLGLDVGSMLAHARAATLGWRDDPWDDPRGGVGPARLATLLAAGVADGRDALHLVVDERAVLLATWIEQLVAESSGKQGTGVLPVVLHRAGDVVARPRAVVVALGDVPGLDALVAEGVPVVTLAWPGCEGLLTEALRWMQAVALLCAQLGVDPFDQPDVASAKAATAAALADGTEPDGPVPLATLGDALATAGYVAVLGYVDPQGPDAVRIERAARTLAARHRVPVTAGFGPRYLHSTGQLHKGGRPDGLHLVIVGEDAVDVAIPGRDHGFARLKRAQAAGDLVALRAAGRLAFRISLDDPDLRG